MPFLVGDAPYLLSGAMLCHVMSLFSGAGSCWSRKES